MDVKENIDPLSAAVPMGIEKQNDTYQGNFIFLFYAFKKCFFRNQFCSQTLKLLFSNYKFSFFSKVVIK